MKVDSVDFFAFVTIRQGYSMRALLKAARWHSLYFGFSCVFQFLPQQNTFASQPKQKELLRPGLVSIDLIMFLVILL